MSFSENLKSRSLDRKIFVAGSALALVGFLVPTIFVTEQIEHHESVPVTVNYEEEVPLSAEEIALFKAESLAKIAANAPASETTTEISSETTTKKSTNFDSDDPTIISLKKTTEKSETTTTETQTTTESAVEASSAETDAILAAAGITVPTTKKVQKTRQENQDKVTYTEERTLKNIFGMAKFFNVADSAGGYAYNATFPVAMWLATIAGIIVFLCAESFVGDVLVWLVGAGFGLAATITIPKYLEVQPIFGYAAVGAYIVFVGWTIALVGIVLASIHVQQQGIRKEI